VVDLQNEFVRDGGLIQVKDAKATLDTNRKLIEFFSKKCDACRLYQNVITRRLGTPDEND